MSTPSETVVLYCPDCGASWEFIEREAPVLCGRCYFASGKTRNIQLQRDPTAEVERPLGF